MRTELKYGVTGIAAVLAMIISFNSYTYHQSGNFVWCRQSEASGRRSAHGQPIRIVRCVRHP